METIWNSIRSLTYISMPLFSCDQQLEITKLTTRENFGPTKYLRRHNGTMTLDPQDPRNLAHCLITLMSDTATGDVL